MSDRTEEEEASKQFLSEEKRQALIRILSSSGYSLTADDISRHLRAAKITEPLYRTIESLRVLQREGFVEYRGGKWTSLVAYVPIADNGLDIAVSPEVKLDTDEKISQIDATKQAVIDETGWGLFRNLCNYYIDCIENEGGATIKISDNELSERACFFGGHSINWPKSEMPWAGTLPTNAGIAQFLMKLTKKESDEPFVIGYPVYIKCEQLSEKSKAYNYYPIFTFTVKPKIETGRLSISTENVRFEVNPSWLSDTFSSDERRAFLSFCGLFNIYDDATLIDRDETRIGFDTLVNVLNSFCKEDVKEVLNPALVKNDTNWTAKKTGIYNRAGIFSGKRQSFTKTLLKELTVIKDMPSETLDKTALKYIFKTASKLSSKPKLEHLGANAIDLIELNEEQFLATESILSNPLSVITGPPGTGKSQVVTVAAVSARFHDKSILLSCRNHKPIDSVVERLNSLIETEQPLVVKANPQEKDQKRFRFSDAISAIQTQQPDRVSKEKWPPFKHRIDDLLQGRYASWKSLQELLYVDDALAELEEQKSVLFEGWPDLPFNELVHVSYSLPLRRISSFLKLLGLERWLKSNRKIYNIPLRVIKDVLKFINLLSLRRNLLKYPSTQRFVGSLDGYQVEQRLKVLKEFIQLCIKARPLERHITALEKKASKELRLASYQKYAKSIKELAHEGLELESKRRVGLDNEDERQSLDEVKAALKLAKNGMASAQQKKAADEALNSKTGLCLKHFPAWAVTTASVGSTIPRVPGLFDLAIIDEASQCSIPDAIPILFRSKAAAVVGDPNQLGYINRLSPSQDIFFRAKNGLADILSNHRFGYGQNSIYDLSAGTIGAFSVMLRKCYRSHFEIGDYCSNAFYQGALETFTDEKKLNAPFGRNPGIEWIDIKGDVVKADSRGAVCYEEQIAILDALTNILITNKFSGSIGVVTPFREQAIRINDLLYNKLPYDLLQRSEIQVATVDSFQGGEKDLILFSLCLGPNMPQGSEVFIKKEGRRFNVAVSRARAVLMVVGNKSYAASCGVSHIESLAKGDWQKRYSRRGANTAWSPHESPWEKILFDALKEEGLTPEPQFRILGRRLDMALRDLENGKRLDIEVDGASYHLNGDGTRRRDDMYRDLQLRAAGWKVIRFWVFELRKDLNACVRKIKAEWEGV